MPLPADQAKLISIFIQTVLYGAYAVVFILTYWVLVHRRPRERPIHKTMLAISFVMFTLATMHIAVNYSRTWMAFITYRNEPGGPAAFFNELSIFTQIFGSTIYVAQTLVGDAVVLYRCFLVWGRNRWVVAFPFLLFLGSCVTGVGILYSFALIEPEAEIFVEELGRWIVSFFSTTFATNVICTGLVALRIWYINRQTIMFTGYSMRPIVFLVIESGAVYSITLLMILVLYNVKSWFQYVLVDAVSPIVGLVFSMIIIRIGLGITSVGGETAAPSRGWHSSEIDTEPLGFTTPIELGPFRAAPNELLTVDVIGSRTSATNEVDLDDKRLSETKFDDSKKQTQAEDLV